MDREGVVVVEVDLEEEEVVEEEVVEEDLKEKDNELPTHEQTISKQCSDQTQGVATSIEHQQISNRP